MHSVGSRPWIFYSNINAWKPSVFDCISLASELLTCIIVYPSLYSVHISLDGYRTQVTANQGASSEFAKQSKESYACLILNDALNYATTLCFSPLNFKIIFTLTCNATPATDTAPPADLV